LIKTVCHHFQIEIVTYLRIDLCRDHHHGTHLVSSTEATAASVSTPEATTSASVKASSEPAPSFTTGSLRLESLLVKWLAVLGNCRFFTEKVFRSKLVRVCKKLEEG
jgi:hypothetical protein